MHSLDLVKTNLDTDYRTQYVINPTITRPSGLNTTSEYSVIIENSADFISLRRALLVSPMLDKIPLAHINSTHSHSNSRDEQSLEKSIFRSTIGTRPFGNELDEKSSLTYDSDEDRNPHGRENIQNSPTSNENDSWSRFNSILLNFLNNYSKLEANKLAQESRNSYKHIQTRQSSSVNDNDANHLDTSSLVTVPSRIDDQRKAIAGSQPTKTTKINLNFVCMAQEGNPVTNMTFDWWFGTMKLPKDFDAIHSSLSEDKPLQIYSNANSTLIITLTRRLDTKTQLDPFRMSFVTISVLYVEDSSDKDKVKSSTRSMRQTDSNKAIFTKAPVIKSRYQSLYNGLRANDDHYNPHQLSSVNNARNGHEFDDSYRDSKIFSGDVDLNWFDWREKLGQLLRCTISNTVGTSDICYANIYTKQADSSQTESSYEYSKWNMPSIAQKSILILSLSIGCALIIFSIFALAVGPQLGSLQVYQKRNNNGAPKNDNSTNTDNSSSQKSSVTGLLGGDNSLQSSSDDDTSARLDQLDLSVCLTAKDPMTTQRRLIQDLTKINQSKGNNLIGGLKAESSDSTTVDYDQPRDLKAQTRLIYRPEGSKLDLKAESFFTDKFYQDSQEPCRGDGKMSQSSATNGNRLLASLRLKPLGRWNADKISDLGRNQSMHLHNQQTSSSETTSTGINSNYCANEVTNNHNELEPETVPAQFNTKWLSENFPRTNFRYSYGGPRRQQSSRPSSHNVIDYSTLHMSGLRNNRHFEHGVTLNPANGYHDYCNPRIVQHNVISRIQPQITRTPIESNQLNSTLPNALDEFMRRRGLDSPIGYNHQSCGYDYTNAYIAQEVPSYDANSNPAQMNICSSNVEIGLNRAPRSDARCHSQSMVYSKPAPPPPPLHNADRNISVTSHLRINSNQDASMNRFGVAPRNLAIPNQSHILADNTLARHQFEYQQSVYANTLNFIGEETRTSSNLFGSPEHIYDVNTYATPEQTPAKRLLGFNNLGAETMEQPNSNITVDRHPAPRVSQLIQSFNSAPASQS